MTETEARRTVPKKPTETDELRAVLEKALGEQAGQRHKISHLTRHVSTYRTSFPIEDLAVHLGDGVTLQLIFKDLAWQSLRDEVQRVKPRFLYDPRREVETYRSILAAGPPGPPLYYGSLIDEEKGRYWLLLEKVPGLELYQVGEFVKWQAAAGWLADLHSAFANKRDSLRRTAPLLLHDESFYWRWFRRAQRFIQENKDAPPEVKEGIGWLAARYHRVVKQLIDLPSTFIHGEFYASNVLILEQNGAYRVAPVDWEMAAIGPAVFDLAALSAGQWTEEQQQAMARAYFAALPGGGFWSPTFAELLQAVNLAQLAIAVQWLGWAKEWSPPVETGQNWLGIALQMAQELNL